MRTRESIAEWSKRHSLVLNPQKSIYILLGTKEQVAKMKIFNPVVKMSGGVLLREDCVKNLGLMMDENLRYEYHIKQKSAKCP